MQDGSSVTNEGAKPTFVWTVKGGNPVSALGVGGNGLWKKIVAHTLNWPSGLVCQATCIKKYLKNREALSNLMK